MQPILGFILIFIAVMYSLNRTAEEIQFKCVYNVQLIRYHRTWDGKLTDWWIITQISKNGCQFNETDAIAKYAPESAESIKTCHLRNWELIHVPS